MKTLLKSIGIFAVIVMVILIIAVIPTALLFAIQQFTGLKSHLTLITIWSIAMFIVIVKYVRKEK